MDLDDTPPKVNGSTVHLTKKKTTVTQHAEITNLEKKVDEALVLLEIVILYLACHMVFM